MTKDKIIALRRAILALIEAGKQNEAGWLQAAFKPWLTRASRKWQ